MVLESDATSINGRHVLVISTDIITGLNKQEKERRTRVERQLEVFTQMHADVMVHLVNDVAAVRSLMRFVKMRADEEKKRAKVISNQEKLCKSANSFSAGGTDTSSTSYVKAATAMDGFYSHYAEGLHTLGGRLTGEWTALKELEGTLADEKGVLDKLAKGVIRRLKQEDDGATRAFSQLERYAEGERGRNRHDLVCILLHAVH
jgi:hypothetical protein